MLPSEGRNAEQVGSKLRTNGPWSNQKTPHKGSRANTQNLQVPQVRKPANAEVPEKESGGRENLLVIGLVFTAENFRKSLPPSCSAVLEQTVTITRFFWAKVTNEM